MAFVVTEKASSRRPEAHKCFYCQSAVGDNHQDDCVFVSKKVKVRLTIEYEIEVPAHWNNSDVEFSRNDGSWCADNLISELQTLSEKQGCLCSTGAWFEYLSDTSEPFLEET